MSRYIYSYEFIRPILNDYSSEKLIENKIIKNYQYLYKFTLYSLVHTLIDAVQFFQSHLIDLFHFATERKVNPDFVNISFSRHKKKDDKVDLKAYSKEIIIF